MLKWLLNRQLRAFGARYDYDVGYLQDITRADTRAGLAFGLLGVMSNYRQALPPAAYFAAKVRTIVLDDCGPCTQLAVNMAIEAGVAPATLQAIVERDLEALPEDAALALRFTEAVLAHAPEADTLGAEITARWGERGRISLAFAIATGRVYPALKFALGHGQACRQVRLGEQLVAPVRAGVAAR